MHSPERTELYNAEKMVVTSLCEGQLDLNSKTACTRALMNTN